MSMIKVGSWGYPIVKVPEDKKYRYASKILDNVKDIPEVYKKAIDQYIEKMSKYAKDSGKLSLSNVGKYDPEFQYFHVIAMHGDIPNDNGDLFRWGSIDDPKMPELLRFSSPINQYVYQTFNGRGNFKNHQNDDVSKAVGVILDTEPNFDGKFIEALLAVDSKKDPELARSIDKGYINSVSMGCRVGYSICTACSHEAKTEQEYCEHVRFSKNRQVIHNGNLVGVYEDNRDCNFIELSWVTVPADRGAVLKTKIADAELKEEEIRMLSALSSIYGEEKAVDILSNIFHKSVSI